MALCDWSSWTGPELVSLAGGGHSIIPWGPGFFTTQRPQCSCTSHKGAHGSQTSVLRETDEAGRRLLTRPGFRRQPTPAALCSQGLQRSTFKRREPEPPNSHDRNVKMQTCCKTSTLQSSSGFILLHKGPNYSEEYGDFKTSQPRLKTPLQVTSYPKCVQLVNIILHSLSEDLQGD